MEDQTTDGVVAAATSRLTPELHVPTPVELRQSLQPPSLRPPSALEPGVWSLLAVPVLVCIGLVLFIVFGPVG